MVRKLRFGRRGGCDSYNKGGNFGGGSSYTAFGNFSGQLQLKNGVRKGAVLEEDTQADPLVVAMDLVVYVVGIVAKGF